MKVNVRLMPLEILFVFYFLISATGCNKNSGELGTAATASFTIAPLTGKINTYVLTSTSQNAFRYQWESGDGSAPTAGDITDTVYYLKKGEYPAKLYAYGRGGYTVATQTVSVAADDPSSQLNNPTFQKLIAHSWKFDQSPTAAAIIVGIESNPGAYYSGGPLADCQLDDAYTFASISSTEYKITYDAKGSTFNGGNVAPNYSCANDRSYSAPFTFSTVVDGTGIATLTIPNSNPPDKFIGTTDIPSNNFRIISITATTMVLRAGTKDGTVFQFKLVAP